MEMNFTDQDEMKTGANGYSGENSTKIGNSQATLSRICWPGRSSVCTVSLGGTETISERKPVR